MTSPSDLRASLEALNLLAAREIGALVAEVKDFAGRGLVLESALPLLIDTYGSAAAAVAADWYDDYREALAVSGGFRAAPVAALGYGPDDGALALVNWARSSAQTPDSMIDLIYGGMQRRVSNAARLTIMGAANEDPKSSGWRRIGDGHNCRFCDMLISRGAVYRESTVRFASHDHCNCQAAPSFGQWSDVVEVDRYTPSSRFQVEYEQQLRAEYNARAREWLADNLVG